MAPAVLEAPGDLADRMRIDMLDRTRACATCEAELQAGRTDRLYCNEECRVVAKNKRRLVARASNKKAPKPRRLQQIVCGDCSGTFMAQSSKAKRCVVCRKSFKQLRDREFAARDREKSRQRQRDWTARQRVINPDYAKIRYASNPEAYRRSARRQKQLRSHLRRTNGPTESFEYAEIFERDGWICGLCGDPVDRDIPWPDDACATLDHVIPLSRGGPHTRANTQLAHWVCNRSKGAEASA